jgi:hypothetical protein
MKMGFETIVKHTHQERAGRITIGKNGVITIGCDTTVKIGIPDGGARLSVDRTLRLIAMQWVDYATNPGSYRIKHNNPSGNTVEVRCKPAAKIFGITKPVTLKVYTGPDCPTGADLVLQVPEAEDEVV